VEEVDEKKQMKFVAELRVPLRHRELWWWNEVSKVMDERGDCSKCGRCLRLRRTGSYIALVNALLEKLFM
jgi:hypothetical protein